MKRPVVIALIMILFVTMFQGMERGMPDTAHAAAVQQGEVTADILYIRAEPNESASILDSYAQGEMADIQGSHGDWYEVRFNNLTGYIHSAHVNTSAGQEQSSASSSSSSDGEIIASSLNVRSSPSTAASNISSLQRGASVELLEKTGDWYRINVNGTEGYVHASHVSVNDTPPADPEPVQASVTKGEVAASSLNIRAEATTDASIVGKLAAGEQIEIHEKSAGWFTIQLSDGSWGYVDEAYIREVGHSAATSGSGSGSISGKTIFLDPGHGGKDPGAIVSGDIYEKAIAMNLSQKIKQQLEGEGANVIMSRTDDTFLSLSQRPALANQAGADLFVSVHANGFTNPEAQGTEVIYSSIGGHPNDSRMLALELQESIANNTGLHNRGTVNRSLHVLDYAQMPAVLIEPGFMTNSRDLSILLHEQDQIAAGIVNGLKSYYE